MKKVETTATRARPAAGDETGKGQQLGCIEVTKVIRDFVPLIADEYGGTFGTIVDETMRAAASADEEIQDLTLHITKEYWEEFKKAECSRISGMSSSNFA